MFELKYQPLPFRLWRFQVYIDQIRLFQYAVSFTFQVFREETFGSFDTVEFQ